MIFFFNILFSSEILRCWVLTNKKHETSWSVRSLGIPTPPWMNLSIHFSLQHLLSTHRRPGPVLESWHLVSHWRLVTMKASLVMVKAEHLRPQFKFKYYQILAGWPRASFWSLLCLTLFNCKMGIIIGMLLCKNTSRCLRSAYSVPCAHFLVCPSSPFYRCSREMFLLLGKIS